MLSDWSAVQVRSIKQPLFPDKKGRCWVEGRQVPVRFLIPVEEVWRISPESGNGISNHGQVFDRESEQIRPATAKEVASVWLAPPYRTSTELRQLDKNPANVRATNLKWARPVKGVLTIEQEIEIVRRYKNGETAEKLTREFNQLRRVVDRLIWIEEREAAGKDFHNVLRIIERDRPPQDIDWEGVIYRDFRGTGATPKELAKKYKKKEHEIWLILWKKEMKVCAKLMPQFVDTVAR